MSETTTRVMESPEVEELFAQFVRNAFRLDQGNVEQGSAVKPRDSERWNAFHEAFTPSPSEPGEDVHLLTRRKSEVAPLPAEPASDDLVGADEIGASGGVVRDAAGGHGALSPRDALETRADRDHIPVRELDRVFSDMARLVQFGHVEDVRRQIAALLEQ